MKKSFIKEYFEGKSGDRLRKTITPDWNTTPKHLELLNIPNNIVSVLEVGCGIGRLLKELNKNIPICYGFDASDDMIRESIEYCNNDSIKIFKCDGEGSLPIYDMYFDYTFSIITFQHIPNIETVKKYISEMYRILKINGNIKYQILRNDEFPGKDTWTYHEPELLIEYMKKIGFKNIKIDETVRWLFITGIK